MSGIAIGLGRRVAALEAHLVRQQALRPVDKKVPIKLDAATRLAASVAPAIRVVGMTTVADQKSYWNLLETVRWICTRDNKRVAVLEDMDEEEQMAVVMFDAKPKLDPSSLLIRQIGSAA